MVGAGVNDPTLRCTRHLLFSLDWPLGVSAVSAVSAVVVAMAMPMATFREASLFCKQTKDILAIIGLLDGTSEILIRPSTPMKLTRLKSSRMDDVAAGQNVFDTWNAGKRFSL